MLIIALSKDHNDKIKDTLIDMIMLRESGDTSVELSGIIAFLEDVLTTDYEAILLESKEIVRKYLNILENSKDGICSADIDLLVECVYIIDEYQNRTLEISESEI